MVDFPSAVAVPRTSDYGPGIADFSAIANAPKNYRQAEFDKQQQQLNAVKVQQAQQQAALSQAFPNGLPTDPKTGAIDYGQVAQTLAKFGDVGGAMSTLQQAPPPMSPLFGGQPQGQPPQGAGGGAAPAAAPPMQPQQAPQPQQPAPQPAAAAPAPSGGTVSALASSVGAPSTVAQNVARAIGVDPGAPLNDAQQQRASGLLQGYATRQSGSGLQRLQSAIYGQESGSGANTQTSVTGARGGMQIEPDTFKRYASAGESIDNPTDNKAVGDRILADYWKKYGGDPARAAVAYFSGPGNVAPAGSPTPWKSDKADPTGKTVSSYVNDVLRKMGVEQLRQGMQPANPRVASAFSALPQGADAAGGSEGRGNLPPSANAASPRPQPGSGQAGGAAPGAGQANVGAAAAPAPGPAAPVQQQPQQAPQAQPPQQQPLVPQVPLPPALRGMEPQQAVTIMRQESARYADMGPRGQGQAAFWKDYADRVEASIKPVSVGSMSSLVDPRSGKTLYQGPGATMYRGPGGETGQLVRMENAERAERGEPPMTAQEEIGFVQGIRPPRSAPAMAVEAFKKDFQAQNGRQPSGEEITKFASDYSRQQSYGRAAGSQGERVENAANEVVQLIPQAIEASRNYARQGGKYVGLNELFQAYDRGTSDPKYNDFVLANFSLVNAYTRAMNPQGIPRIQERLEQHALGILSTATDEKAYEVQVRRLWKEVQASKTATAETAKGVNPGDINAPVPGLDAPSGSSASNSGGIVKWERGPDGVPRPAQ